MKLSDRIIWVVGILIIDTLFFIVPVVALLAIYVILARPPWFQEWVGKLYQDV